MRLVVHDVAKDFVTDRRKVHALAGVNLEVREGEFLGIIGPTRMEYERAISIVGYLGRLVGEMINA